MRVCLFVGVHVGLCVSVSLSVCVCLCLLVNKKDCKSLAEVQVNLSEDNATVNTYIIMIVQSFHPPPESRLLLTPFDFPISSDIMCLNLP